MSEDHVNYQTAKAKFDDAYVEHFNRMRPSVYLPVKVIRDGNAWSCSLYWPEERNMMEQLVTYGDTPEEACINFDKAWTTKEETK